MVGLAIKKGELEAQQTATAYEEDKVMKKIQYFEESIYEMKVWAHKLGNQKELISRADLVDN